jgi:hypothetical protein
VGGGAGLDRPAMEGLAGARGAGGCGRATEVLDELSVRHAQRGRHDACHGVSRAGKKYWTMGLAVAAHPPAALTGRGHHPSPRIRCRPSS